MPMQPASRPKCNTQVGMHDMLQVVVSHHALLSFWGAACKYRVNCAPPHPPHSSETANFLGRKTTQILPTPGSLHPCTL